MHSIGRTNHSLDRPTSAGSLSRRGFLAASLAMTAGTLMPSVAAQPSGTPPVCVFSKHLQFIDDFDELAKTYKELGLDGCDLTVRPGGHILPEDAPRKLPMAVEAFRRQGLEIYQVTTRLLNGRTPEAATILEAASALGIRYFRCGTHRYDEARDIHEQLESVTGDLRSLADVAREYGMVAGYHNHSGPNYVGAPLWDLAQMYRAIDSPHLGSNFDMGHAMVEGGYGAWAINARLLAPHTHMMAAKDFVWSDGAGPRWVPYGEGRVPAAAMLGIMRNAGFAGPISLHFEYRVSDTEILDHMKQAAARLRADLAEAGYSA